MGVSPVNTSFGLKRAALEANDLLLASVVFLGSHFAPTSYVPGGGTAHAEMSHSCKALQGGVGTHQVSPAPRSGLCATGMMLAWGTSAVFAACRSPLPRQPLGSLLALAHSRPTRHTTQPLGSAQAAHLLVEGPVVEAVVRREEGTRARAQLLLHV